MPSFALTRRFRAVLFVALAAFGLVLASPRAAEAKPSPRARSHARGPARADSGKRVVKHPWASPSSAKKHHAHANAHARPRPHKRR